MAESAIRRCHKQVGLTQQALADALDVKKVAVCAWETGAYEPTPRHAIALCRILRCLQVEDIYPLPEEEAA